MHHLLDRYYQGPKLDGVGPLLGEIALLDRDPVNSAIAGDRKDAVEFAPVGGKAGNLVLTTPGKRF